MNRAQGILLGVVLVIGAGTGIALWATSRPPTYNYTPGTQPTIVASAEPTLVTVGGITVLATDALCEWALTGGLPMTSAVAESFIPNYAPNDASDKRAGQLRIALGADSSALTAACAN